MSSKAQILRCGQGVVLRADVRDGAVEVEAA